MYRFIFFCSLVVLTTCFVSCTPFYKQSEQGIAAKKNSSKEITDVIPLTITTLENTATTDPEQAIQKARAILNNYTEPHQIVILSYIYYVMGRAYSSLDQPTEALNHYNQAQFYLLDTDYLVLKGVYASYIGNVFFNLRLFEKAQAQYEKALVYFKESGLLNKITAAASNLALVEKEIGNYEGAQNRYVDLLQIRTGNDKAFTYILLAELNLISKQYEDSILVWLDRADQILDNYIGGEYGKFKGYVQEYKGDYLVSKDVVLAEKAYNTSIEWYQKHDVRLWMRASQKMANLEMKLGKSRLAEARMKEVTTHTSEAVSLSLWYDLNAFYAEIMQKNGKVSEAYKIMQKLAEKKIQYEEQRARLSLSMLDFSNQLNESNKTIQQQQIQLIKSRWMIGVIISSVLVFVIGTFVYVKREQIIGQQRLTLEKQRVELLESRVVESRWRNLRLQLKPHFLYNILSSLQALVHISPEQASKLIEHLAGYFQYILSAESQEIVSLSRELNLCEEYLSLQEIRYSGKLQFSINAERTLKDVLVPSMIIFPLVENAAKYGYKTTKDGKLAIGMAVHFDESMQRLTISITNTGTWVEPKKVASSYLPEYQGGIGWQNIQQRLESHFGNEWELTSFEKDDQVHVVLAFPLLEMS